MSKDDVKRVVVYNLKEWRKWLVDNHISERKVALISYKKHTGKPSISHNEAMLEAISFGWIDTTIKRIDEDRYARFFVKRGENANWSKNTLKYARELISAGRMKAQGMLRYKQALKKKPHDHGIPKKPKMPAELKRAFTYKKNELKIFEKYSPSRKNMLYRWILRAKTYETREKRVDSIIKDIFNKNKPWQNL